MDTPPGAPADNARVHKRHSLAYYLKVYDRKTGEVLGHLVDLAEGGVMLMREAPYAVGAAHEMRLRWRDAGGRLQVADFEGTCRWSRPDPNPDFHDGGFSLRDITPGAIEAIRGLIRDLGMPG